MSLYLSWFLVRMSANVLANKFPVYFAEMLLASSRGDYEVKIDAKGQVRVPLRSLPPDAGDHKSEHSWDCGIFCELDDKAENQYKEEQADLF